jgi:hypothetical protein
MLNKKGSLSCRPYVKVLSMQRDKASGETGFARDIFYTRLIPADTARAAAPRRFYGGS